MARRPRFAPAGYAQHVIQRGNNRQTIFCCDHDRALYTRWLRDYAEEYEVAIHAWVYMSNHVHLLVTPDQADGLSLTMQALGRRYVRYFNRKYERSGTLFEGRFRSCLVADRGYLLACCRYIEMNPVRAGIVEFPEDYLWSSYGSNALGLKSSLISPHKSYLALGASQEQRQRAYRGLFVAREGDLSIEEIRLATNKGLAFGGARFKDEFESIFACSVTPGPRGRPRLVEKKLL
ncbi:MAG: transposase [Halieaceae bacterium]